jgi:hypothetical protein
MLAAVVMSMLLVDQGFALVSKSATLVARRVNPRRVQVATMGLKTGIVFVAAAVILVVVEQRVAS